MVERSDVHVAIIGAGPVGLDAALAVEAQGFGWTLFEAGDAVGSGVRRWEHVRMFSPWSMNVSPRMRAALPSLPGDTGGCPSGAELLERVLEPVSALAPIRHRLRLRTRVDSVTREGLLKSDRIGDPRRAAARFRLLLETPEGERTAHADVVLDCTGALEHPNWAGSGGIPAPGERSLGARVERHPPDVAHDPERWRGRRVLLVGAGHSARTAARDLAALGGRGGAAPRVVWVLGAADPRGWPIVDDPLPERAALDRRALELAEGASVHVTPLRDHFVQAFETGSGPTGPVDAVLRGPGGEWRVEDLDTVLSLTGYAPAPDLYRQLQVHECYATGAPMRLAARLVGGASADCLSGPTGEADTLRSPEPDFYILGSKSYGRTSTFLLRNGWSQVDDAVSLVVADRS